MQCSKADVLHVLFGMLLVELLAVLIARLVVWCVVHRRRNPPPAARSSTTGPVLHQENSASRDFSNRWWTVEGGG